MAITTATTMLACGRKDVSDRTSGGSNKPEFTAHQSPRTSATTAEFWTWFESNAAALLADKNLQNVMKTINERLEPGHPGIFVEIGVDAGQRTLVISADGLKDYFPTVQQVYAKRPKVPGWNIIAFRQRDTAPVSIDIHGAKLDAAEMKFVAEREGDKLSLNVFVPRFTETAEMKQGLYIVLDHTIGEYDMETRIGGIEFVPIEKAPLTAVPLPDLPALLDNTFTTGQR